MFWIKYYTNIGCKLVNSTIGGEGSNGFQNKHHSEETKQILRDKRKLQIFSKEDILKITDENNGRSKLSDNDVREIFRLVYVNKLTHKEIAKQFNIARKYIYMLLTGIKRKSIYNEYINNLTV